MIAVFEAEAKRDETGDHEWGADECGAEADFGFEMAMMGVDVASSDEVVEPVASDLTQDGGDDGCDVEEADLFGAEVVEWGEEDGERGVDHDGP